METDGTLGKRIWLAARLTDKRACKSAQPVLLESENTSVAAGDVYTLIRRHTINFCVTLQYMQFQTETDLSGSYPAWIRVALYRWAAVSCPCPCGIGWT